jgi:GntP family gluconate:H+ symporter
LWGFVIGLPVAAIAGPVFARWAVRHVQAEPPPAFAQARHEGLSPPGFGLTLFTITLPVGLMLLGTLAELTLPKENSWRVAATFIGNPTIALGASVLVALWSFGTRCGHSAAQLLKFTEQSVAQVGMTLLIVGAGGGFARVLREAGVANSLGNLAQLLHLPPLLYGWLVAAFVRVATGSATVAITAASGVLVPLVAAHPELNRELLIVAIGCGSLFLSHLNDSGFWIVKDCFGLTVPQTLRTWTVTETLVGLSGLVITLLVDALWRVIHG